MRDIDIGQSGPDGVLRLRPGFREASVKELQNWNIDAKTLRGLWEAAKDRPDNLLVVDDVFGGTAWKRNQEGHGALILRADVLEEALGPHIK